MCPLIRIIGVSTNWNFAKIPQFIAFLGPGNFSCRFNAHGVKIQVLSQFSFALIWKNNEQLICRVGETCNLYIRLSRLILHHPIQIHIEQRCIL